MRIKFVSKTPVERMAPLWQRFVTAELEGLFTFDPDDPDYTHLAVYEDLPPLPGERKVNRVETLRCAKDRALLFVTEPSSIRRDGLHYLAQFGTVVTSRRFSAAEAAFLARHGTEVDGVPALATFYGRDMDGDDHLSLADLPPALPDKTRTLSTVTSTKAMRHTVHAQRLAFVRDMKARLGDTLSLFGRGIDEVRDKREAMEDFRYHIAIENHIQPGHFTEKLTDSFIAGCLPFYFGDPLARYRFSDAFIPINIFDPDGAERIIRNALEADEWSRRRDAIAHARDNALRFANPLWRAADWARGTDIATSEKQAPQRRLYGRHAYRRAHPWLALRDAAHSARMGRSILSDPLQGYAAE